MKSRLFIKSLLMLLATSLTVVVLMVVTMQFFVYRNFSDYVVQQELDSLDDIAHALSLEYQKDDSWENFRNDPRQWHDIVNRYFPDNESHPIPPARHKFNERPLDREGRAILNDQDRRSRNDNRPKREYDRQRAGRDLRPPPMPPRRAPGLSPMARRLSVFDVQKKVVFGNPVMSEQALRPINNDNKIIGWLGLKKERQMMSPTDLKFLKRQSQTFYVIGILVLMMAIIISVIFSRHLTSPVKQLAKGAKAIRNRRFDERITVTSNDELGQLAKDFNAMSQTLQSYENVRRQWLSDIAHELRTPLAVIFGEIEALQDGIR
jgi:two-component system sensor histidine kinase BaeS